MPTQSLQNESGQTNFIVRDIGTSNVFYNVKTLRFDPIGSVERGPGPQEVTIKTNTGSGGAGEPYANVLWEVGTTADNIQAKFAPSCVASGDYAVAHGDSSISAGDNSYTGGQASTAGGSANYITGLTNITDSGSANVAIRGGTGNDITRCRNAVIIAGSDNSLTLGGHNVIISGGTSISTGVADRVHIGQHLEVGHPSLADPGSIKRVSANPWEDGNCGNSAELWFVPTDFKVMDSFTGPGDPMIPYILSSADTILDTTNDKPVIYHNTTISGDAQYVGVRLLPKGFKTQTGRDGATFYFADRPLGWCSSIEVFEGTLKDQLVDITSLGSESSVNAQAKDINLTLQSLEGNGDKVIIVVANQVTNTNLPAEGLLSVKVKIERS